MGRSLPGYTRPVARCTRKCHRLRNQRRNARLLTIMANGNTNQWDCTCLFYAILYSDCLGPFLNPTVQKSVDELREIRNEVFAHTTDGRLTDVDFDDAMRKIVAAFKAFGLNTVEVEAIKNQKTFLTDELSSIQQQPSNEKKRYAKFKSFCVLPTKPSHETTDRADEVTRINHEMEKLRSTKKNETTVIYLSGNPGCGKSEIARQIGNEYFDKIPEEAAQLKFVFTFNASGIDTLLQSYVDFAIRLSCDEDVVTRIASSKDLSVEEKINQMKNLINPKVQIYSSWLIIVDNVNDLQAVLKYLPQAGEKTSGDGQILVTTQDSQAIPFDSYTYHYPSLKEGMKEDDAIALLAQISGITGDRDTLLNIARALDFQPLALACAAVYMQHVFHYTSQSQAKWEKYLLKLQEGKREATEEAFVKTTKTYRSAMTAAVKLALDRVASEDKIMMHAFQFLSVIANEPIPLKYVVQHVMNCMPDDEDLVAAHISSSSLVISSQDGEVIVVRVHQVVYHGLQELFKNDEIDVLKLMIVFENLSSFKKVYKATKSEIIGTRPFAPHFVILSMKIEHLLQHSNLTAESPHITDCLFKAGCISLVHDNYKASEILLHLCLSIQEQDCNSDKSLDGKQPCGDSEAALANTHKSLGYLYIQQRNFGEAQMHLEAALAIEDKLQEEDHTELVVTLRKLGFCLSQLRQYEKAESYLKRAVMILEEDGPCTNDALLAGILVNLVQILQRQGEIGKAKTYCERVLELEQYLNDGEDSDLVGVFNDLGVCFSRFNEDQKAATFYEKSLKIMESIHHADHSRKVVILQNLGKSLIELRKFEEAKSYLERSLRIQDKGDNENDPQLADTLELLDLCSHEEERYEMALAYWEEAIKERTSGKGQGLLGRIRSRRERNDDYFGPLGAAEGPRCSIL